jgi:serine/threonine-protein kinase
MEPITQATPTPQPRGSEPPASPDLSGRTIGDFQVLRRLGQGGMGQVYLAEQVSLKRKVALKVLRPDLAGNETSLARFKAEAEAVARATHANIVQVYYIGTVDGLPFMALEYVEGKNLREYLAKKGPPDLPLALNIMRQVASALVRAGELGIVHRDIKPDNILLTRKGEVKVADFGLSRVLTTGGDLNLTQSGVTMGTPLYMAPEQAEGKAVDCRTDIYSFGVTCYHVLSGEPPFRGATAVEVAIQHITGQAAPLHDLRPDLPDALCAIVHRMMARRPDDRFQTAREMLREIGRVREGLSGAPAVQPLISAIDVEPVATEGTSSVLVPASIMAGTVVDLERPVPPRRGHWWIVCLFVGSLVAAVYGGSVLARVRHSSVDATSHATSSDAMEAEGAPLDDEPALRRTAEIYLTAGSSKDVSVGISLCVKLAILYLEQHRLDEADKLFTRLDNFEKVQSYHILGRLGRGIVLALENQPVESNKLFREIAYFVPHRETAPAKNAPKRPDAEMVKVYQNPAFLYWLARAVRYNHINGLPDDQLPIGFNRLLEIKTAS